MIGLIVNKSKELTNLISHVKAQGHNGIVLYIAPSSPTIPQQSFALIQWLFALLIIIYPIMGAIWYVKKFHSKWYAFFKTKLFWIIFIIIVAIVILLNYIGVNYINWHYYHHYPLYYPFSF